MTQWRDRSEPSHLGLNSRQTLDLSRVARGLNLTRRTAEEKVSRRSLYRGFDIQEFRSPEDESLGTRKQKSQNSERT
jgi:hypothetical protein